MNDEEEQRKSRREEKILNTLINYLTRDLMARASLRYTQKLFNSEGGGHVCSFGSVTKRESLVEVQRKLQKSLFNEFIKKSIKFYDYLFFSFPPTRK